MAFALSTYPITYRAKFSNGKWSEEYLEKPHKTQEEEAAMGDEERAKLKIPVTVTRICLLSTTQASTD